MVNSQLPPPSSRHYGGQEHYGGHVAVVVTGAIQENPRLTKWASQNYLTLAEESTDAVMCWSLDLQDCVQGVEYVANCGHD